MIHSAPIKEVTAQNGLAQKDIVTKLSSQTSRLLACLLGYLKLINAVHRYITPVTTSTKR